MKTRIVTKQEFLEFIFQQPDEREINFGHESRRCSCGCPMVQFGLERGIEFERVGRIMWISDIGEHQAASFEPGFNYCDFRFDGELKQKCTYGQLKALLTQNGMVPHVAETTGQASA